MESGRVMIDAVHERWCELPPDHRPKLVLYGESLGSMAGQGAFGWLPDIARMGFSSVLWVGPPNASPLWRAITVRRDPGTPEVEPRYDNGRTVRFRRPPTPPRSPRDTDAPWEGTRVLFLQHASDPIVWWSADLLFNRPDWLREPPGRDRTPAMRWYPIVTFWQVAADMTNAAVGARRPRPQLRRIRARRVGGRRPARRLDARDTERIRTALEKTDAEDGPEYYAASRFRADGAGGSAGAAGAVWSARGSRSGIRCSGPRDRSAPGWCCGHPRPLGLRPPHCGRGCGSGSRPPRRWSSVSPSSTALSPVRAAMAERDLPLTGALAVGAHPFRHGVVGGGRVPGGIGHGRGRRVRADGGRLLQSRGVRAVPHRRRPQHRRAGDRHGAGHRRGGLGFALLAERSAAWPRRCSPIWRSTKRARSPPQACRDGYGLMVASPT